MIDLVNWQQEEPTGYGGGRQLSLDGTSRVTGDCYARICERLGVKIPGATRRRPAMVVPYRDSWSTRSGSAGTSRHYRDTISQKFLCGRT